MLWALALWGAAHLLANGELALVILFGSTAGFSLLGMVMIDRRQRRQRGEAAWQALSVRTSAVPLAAWLTGRWRPKGRPDHLRGGLAVLLWATLIALHSRIIGMPALPPALWW